MDDVLFAQTLEQEIGAMRQRVRRQLAKQRAAERLAVARQRLRRAPFTGDNELDAAAEVAKAEAAYEEMG